MKAVVLREFGPAAVMRVEEVADPAPREGEVVVAVHAVSVNRTLDLVIRAGRYAKPVTLPHVLGVDPAGVIVAVGAGVTERKVGDRVVVWPHVGEIPGQGPRMLGVHLWGGYAERVAAPARSTYRIPDALDFVTACVVMRHAPMAFYLLRDQAKVQPGEWVLVMGAAGGLGSAGVQAAKALGAKVIAGAGADARVEAAVALGADAGVNYRAQDLTAEVLRITQGQGVGVVFENIGDPDLFPKAFATLRRHGRLVTAGGHGGGIVPLDVNRLYLNQISVIGATGYRPEDIEASLAAAARGEFRVMIDRVLPLSEAVHAHELVESGAVLGKVVLDPTRM